MHSGLYAAEALCSQVSASGSHPSSPHTCTCARNQLPGEHLHQELAEAQTGGHFLLEGWSLNINQHGHGLWEGPLSCIPITCSEGFGKVRRLILSLFQTELTRAGGPQVVSFPSSSNYMSFYYLRIGPQRDKSTLINGMRATSSGRRETGKSSHCALDRIRASPLCLSLLEIN